MARFSWYWDRIAEGYFRPTAPAPHVPDPSAWRDDDLTIAWLGHATLLLNFFGLWIVTDPVLLPRVGIRVGPITFGPKRFIAPALHVRELPPLDLILLSHAHMDHLDMGTLRKLPRDVPVVTATSTSDLLTRFRTVVEVGWGECRTMTSARGAAMHVEAFGVRHWGARVRTDMHRGFNGYLIERHGRRVCIAGDTARTSFTAIGRKGPIDVMAVPIGAYNPWIASHCTPEQAIAMADEAGARFVIPIHHRTFRLSIEPMEEPIRRFTAAIAPERIALTEIGETFRYPAARPL